MRCCPGCHKSAPPATRSRLWLDRPAARVVAWLALGACLSSGVALFAVAEVARPQLPPEQELRQALQYILARPEYQPPKPSLFDGFYRALARVLDTVLRWIFKPLEWIIDRLTRLGGEASPTVRWLVTGLLTVLLALVLLHLYYTASGAFGRRRRAAPSGDRLPAPTLDPLLLTRQAQAAAARGEYREALRLLYLAALLRLDHAGVLDYHPSLTNWSCADAVPASSGLAQPFRDLTALADRALYAAAPVNADHFRRGEELAGRLEVGPS